MEGEGREKWQKESWSLLRAVAAACLPPGPGCTARRGTPGTHGAPALALEACVTGLLPLRTPLLPLTFCFCSSQTGSCFWPRI